MIERNRKFIKHIKRKRNINIIYILHRKLKPYFRKIFISKNPFCKFVNLDVCASKI